MGDDATVYSDDWILHASDQDYEPYYRPMSSLEDDLQMMGNCRHAGSGFGKNEMYPCFDEKVTYGLAITGLDVSGTLPVSVVVDTNAEPNIRSGARPSNIHAKITVADLKSGGNYVLYRYKSTSDLPSGPLLIKLLSTLMSLLHLVLVTLIQIPIAFC